MTEDDLANPLFPTFTVNPPLKRPLIVQCFYDALTFLVWIALLAIAGAVVLSPFMMVLLLVLGVIQ
jgi:hypothetical protein